MKPYAKHMLFVSVLVAAVYLAAMLSGMTCPILLFTGIPCPGCGMTRAWLQFFHGNVSEAFRFHPLFPLPVVLLVLYLLRHKLSPRLRNRITIALIVLVLAVWLLRFFLPGDPVVRLNFSGSILGKLFSAD